MTPETVADSDWLNSGGGGGGLSLSLSQEEGGGASRFSFFAGSCARLTKRLADTAFTQNRQKSEKKSSVFLSKTQILG
jgi:hypothetical protein